MMSSRKRIIYTLFLWMLSVIFFMMVTLTANRLIFADRVRARDTAKLEAIDRIIDGLSSSLTEAEQKTVRQYEINAVLTAKALPVKEGMDAHICGGEITVLFEPLGA